MAKRESVPVPFSPCSISQFEAVLDGAPIILTVADDAFSKARAVYLEEARSRKVYGYCTGLGELFTKEIGRCGPSVERVVIEEHSAQTGPEAPPALVRAFLAVRLSQLSTAPAPVRPAVARRLLDAVNRGVAPVIHAHGSVGASGDLSPSAEAVRCIYYGEGEAVHRGERLPCGEALRRAGMAPLDLEPGEALFLINNTAWSTTLCLAGGLAVSRAIDALTRLMARAVRIARASKEHYDPALLEAKRCPSALPVAARLLESAAVRPRHLQAPYSLRCAPQILGATLRVVEEALRLVMDEACASTENPVLAGGRVLHGCNFHAVRVAYACSMLQTAAGYMSVLVERAAAQMLRGEVTGLPTHLAGEGSSVGAMIAHYSMAALSARARGRAALEMLLNTPTSGLQEDVVSMAPEMAWSLLEQARALAGMLGLMDAILWRAEQLARGEDGPFTGLQREALMREGRMLREVAPWLAPSEQ